MKGVSTFLTVIVRGNWHDSGRVNVCVKESATLSLKLIAKLPSLQTSPASASPWNALTRRSLLSATLSRLRARGKPMVVACRLTRSCTYTRFCDKKWSSNCQWNSDARSSHKSASIIGLNFPFAISNYAPDSFSRYSSYSSADISSSASVASLTLRRIIQPSP